jgi:hypothetical protein
VELEEGLLSEIFGLGNTSDHAQTKGIDVPLVD